MSSTKKEAKPSILKKTYPFQILALVAIVCLAVGSIGMLGISQTGLLSLSGAKVAEPTVVKTKVSEYLNLVMKFQYGEEYSVLITDVKEASTNSELYTVEFAIMQDGVAVQSNSINVTKDGKYTVSSDIDEAIKEVKSYLQEETEETGQLKSDKPVVELFVMSHCPYGTQIEKGIIPVLKSFGDKIDFTLRFVDYAMHGEKEVKEQTNQYCIQKEEPEKLISYLECFLKEGNGEACLLEANINTTKLETCKTQADNQFQITALLNDKSTYLSGVYPQFNIDASANEKYGIQGSPTLVINGKQVSAGRSPSALATAICASFNSEPSVCSDEFSTENPSAGFGYTGSGTSSGSCS